MDSSWKLRAPHGPDQECCQIISYVKYFLETPHLKIKMYNMHRWNNKKIIFINFFFIDVFNTGIYIYFFIRNVQLATLFTNFTFKMSGFNRNVFSLSKFRDGPLEYPFFAQRRTGGGESFITYELLDYV